MGDSKFVPNLDSDQFDVIVKSSRAYKERSELTELWSKCKRQMFELTDRTKCIGLGNNGVTTYMSDNFTQEDCEYVSEWLKLKKLIAYNCRTFKTVVNGRNTYEIKLASAEQGKQAGITIEPEEYKGNTFFVTRGDYSPLLALVNENLKAAQTNAANDNQREMIEYYIKCFTEGNLEHHKDGTR